MLSRVTRGSTGVVRESDVRLVGTGPTENGEIGGRFWAGANYRGMNIKSDQRRSIGSVIGWLGSLPVLISGVFIAFAGTATADENVAEQDLKHPPVAIGRFLGQHCRDCHSGDEPEAGLSLSELPFDLNKPHAFESWRRVYERVRDGEMPPDSGLGPEDTAGFLKGLDKRLMESDSRDIADRGRLRGRRLTRTEYEHTIHSLLGIDLPLRDQLPEDAASHEFETVADGQQLSYHLLARYLDVADLALAAAFDRALNGDVTYAADYPPARLSRGIGRRNYRGPETRNGESISWPIYLAFYGRMTSVRIPQDGWYRITLRDVRAVNPVKGGTVWGTLRSGVAASAQPILYDVGIVEATETPRDLQFEAWIQRRHTLELKPNDRTLRRAPNQTGRADTVAYRDRNEERGFSGIAHRGIRIERFYPNADREHVTRNLFGDAKQEQWKADPNGVLKRLVTRFASRAFRRPVTSDEVADYQRIGLDVLAEYGSFVDALRAAYRTILCSPRMLTFVESPGALDDYAIASRLSYALWTDTPDETLLRIAGEGKLRRDEVLAAQIDRMLDDPRSKQFINSFTDQWLKLNQIDFTTPDSRQFRTFDPVLQESMLRETRTYVSKLIEQDLSVACFVDSDFACLNERLARHYRITDNIKSWQPGNGIQTVSLSPSSRRGGLITQGAILKVTADGTTTSPVVRGVFVNERILGVRVPPPPPGIPAVEPDVRGATSIRDQLAKHRSDASCNACHRTIDPPGFALESFDPVGVWRDRYGMRGRGAAIDPSGKTADGQTFEGLLTWQQLYVNQPERIARGFAEQFLTYATGAPIRYSDEPAVDQIVADSKASGYGMRTLIHAALTSDLFLKK
ncbi:hypothetical protein KOR42_16880 [Thalassoglobus neptunius]|uniref:Planctomycete cytochrome C n=2 Tax=Thalassoglobus neptunius TaxID=1938619 RepID=A0A5C5X5W9_9PLAN|nr:hypothetical protein KOR42_16880 [Thalassoglobus neptunius]